MKKPKKTKPKKEKEIPKKTSEAKLEKETQKTEIHPVDKKEGAEEFMDELDAQGIISAGELRQILRAENKLHQLENVPVSRSLEGGLIFAPRARNPKEGEGKIYSETKYDTKYAESRYAEKTPGTYAGSKETAPKESPGNSGNGNSSNGSSGSP